MTARYDMTYQVPMDLLGRAMVSWTGARNSRAAQIKRFGLCVLGGAAIGVLVAVTGVGDVITGQLLAGLLVGFYIGLTFWFFKHKRDLGRLSEMAAVQLDKQGPTHAVFTPDGVTLSTRLGSSKSNWKAYDQVIEMADATALRSGGVIYPVPHNALPDGVDAATFHADLQRWQGAGQ